MIDISSKYNPLFNSDARYFFLSGSRGSGKSFVVTLFLVNSLLEGDNVLFTRNTMTQAHISIIPLFVEMIELLGLSSEFKIKQKEIICIRNKSKTLVKTTTNNINNHNLAFFHFFCGES